ncbi:MAG: hypothetical protein KBF74_09655 [Ferruginibacter sp.]|nr:hypothetical protein [Ferruginibacter sp.]
MISCSSSRITHSWKSDNIPEKKFSKIMVVSVIAGSDWSIRDKMEAHLVGDLTDRGYVAVSAIKEYGPKYFENMKEAEVLDKLSNSGVDAVITVVLLDKNKERYYVPGRVYYSPYTIYQRNFWGYYTTIYERIYTPGYYQVDTKYFWESNFYDLKNKNLLYTVQTETFDPESVEILAHEYGLLIVNDMNKKAALK